jgi:hypothetical protein
LYLLAMACPAHFAVSMLSSQHCNSNVMNNIQIIR